MTKPNDKLLPWEILSDYPGYRLVPESEARRLHALDERVKLAEEAVCVTLAYFDVIDNYDGLHHHHFGRPDVAISLLREFMKGREGSE